MTNQWCAIESAYTDHDTAHHGSTTGFAVGDRVKITGGEYEGKRGLVQQIRNRDITVRIPGRSGNTLTAVVGPDDLEMV